MDERTWNEMSEHSQALIIANRWLDFKMNALTQMVPGDPDCDACVLARQFIRMDCSDLTALRAERDALRETLLEVAQRCENLGYTGMANFARAKLEQTEKKANVRKYPNLSKDGQCGNESCYGFCELNGWCPGRGW